MERENFILPRVNIRFLEKKLSKFVVASEAGSFHYEISLDDVIAANKNTLRESFLLTMQNFIDFLKTNTASDIYLADIDSNVNIFDYSNIKDLCNYDELFFLDDLVRCAAFLHLVQARDLEVVSIHILDEDKVFLECVKSVCSTVIYNGPSTNNYNMNAGLFLNTFNRKLTRGFIGILFSFCRCFIGSLVRGGSKGDKSSCEIALVGYSEPEHYLQADRSRFWGGLPPLLRSMNIKFKFFVWDVRAYHGAKSKYIYYFDDQITISDCFWALKRSVQVSVSNLSVSVSQLNLGCTDLFGFDCFRLFYPHISDTLHGSSCFRFFIKYRILFKAHLLVEKRIIYLCENQGWERLLCKIATVRGCRLSAVLHSEVRFWDLRYWYGLYLNKDHDESILPDDLLCKSSAEYKVFKGSRSYRSKIREVESLRRDEGSGLVTADLEEKSSSLRTLPRVLVFFDLEADRLSLMVNCICKLIHEFGSEIDLLCKYHPSTRSSDKASFLRNFETDGVANELLRSADIAIVSDSSSVARHAILIGVPTVIIRPQGRLPFYDEELDCNIFLGASVDEFFEILSGLLDAEYPACRSRLQAETLKSRLNEVQNLSSWECYIRDVLS